ncbi:hypothetical protein Gotur_011074 [Gossypium turneri]
MLQSFGCDSGYYLRSRKNMICSNIHPSDPRRLSNAGQVTKSRTSEVVAKTRRF